MSTGEEFRPPADERVHRDRTDPVRINLRTKWKYSEREAHTGPTRHAFARGGNVMGYDGPALYGAQFDVVAHLWRAIEAFGDDRNLVIEVRPDHPGPDSTGGQGESVVEWGVRYEDGEVIRAGRGVIGESFARYSFGRRADPMAARLVLVGPRVPTALMSRLVLVTPDTFGPWQPVEEAEHHG